jgi:HlyD family secretion protein
MALAAGVGLSILGWWFTRESKEPNNALTLYGNVDIREVDLAFNGNERIATMKAVEGERVEAGQLLAELETQSLSAAVARAKAQLAAQHEVVSKLETGSRPQEIRKARADVLAAQAEARNADANYWRLRDLAKQNLASPQDRDDAKTAATAARAHLESTKETLELVLEGPRQEDIKAAKATLKAFEAELAIAQRNLANASLHAPSSGIIQNRILEPGDMASPQKPVYSLALTDPLWVRAYIEETNLGKIHPGLRAKISTDSYPGKTYKAWVGYISPTAEFTPKSVETTELRADLVYQVRLYVCDPQNELRLGMPATATIPLDQKPTSVVSSDPSPCDAP